MAQMLLPLFQGLGMSDIPAIDHVTRKVAHFLEYALLGVLSTIDVGRTRHWPLVAVIGVAVPSIDETIQLFVPGRSGQVSDVVLDMTGFSVGVGAVMAVRAVRSRR